MSTTDLVVQAQKAGVDLSASPQNQLKMLQVLLDYLRTADDAGEVLNGLQRARLIREWVKISKAASAISVEATKIEMVALRRIAQLNALTDISAAHRKAAIGFAAMTDKEFDKLLKSVQGISTALGVWRTLEREREYNNNINLGTRIARDYETGEATPIAVDYNTLREAASAILHASIDDREVITVTGAAMSLAEKLDMSDDFESSAAVREGLRRVVRNVFRLMTVEESVEGAPPHITYCDAEASWVKIPFKMASIRQVQAWADFRDVQAQGYLEAAKEARGLVDQLTAMHHKHPTVRSAARLLAFLEEEIATG